MSTAADTPVSCSICGRTGVPDVTWMIERDERRGPRWVCPSCVRQHARSIEAKLDPEWWS